MRDDAVGGTAFIDRHFPLIGSRLHQHHACSCAADAHVFFGAANALAATGAEATPRTLARHALARRRIFGGDFGPVAFKFFGDQLREARQAALPHFGSGDADHDGVVGFYHHPCIDLGRTCGWQMRFCGADEGNMKSDHQTTGSSGRALQETTTGNGERIHVVLLSV